MVVKAAWRDEREESPPWRLEISQAHTKVWADAGVEIPAGPATAVGAGTVGRCGTGGPDAFGAHAGWARIQGRIWMSTVRHGKGPSSKVHRDFSGCPQESEVPVKMMAHLGALYTV